MNTDGRGRGTCCTFFAVCMLATLMMLATSLPRRPVDVGGRLRHCALSMSLSPKDVAAVANAAKIRLSEPLTMPKRLSPTAVSTFKECPQLFLFNNMWKLPQPPSAVLTKGILVHAALEKVFDLPPAKRAEMLHDVLRDEWRVERLKPPRDRSDDTALVDLLFSTVDEERTWGKECLKLLDNWRATEDPSAPPLGEPMAREAWLSAKLDTGRFSSQRLPPLSMVGKVDRLDRMPAGADGTDSYDGVVIVDYKTGKAPDLNKYSSAMNEEIRQKTFFQLRCYALLLAKGGLGGAYSGRSTLARRLRLLYLAESPGGAEGLATPLEEELPPPNSPTYDQVLEATEAEVVAAWAEIHALVQRGEPEAFEHCTRSFCQCHQLRPIVFDSVRDA